MRREANDDSIRDPSAVRCARIEQSDSVYLTTDLDALRL